MMHHCVQRSASLRLFSSRWSLAQGYHHVRQLTQLLLLIMNINAPCVGVNAPPTSQCFRKDGTCGRNHKANFLETCNTYRGFRARAWYSLAYLVGCTVKSDMGLALPFRPRHSVDRRSWLSSIIGLRVTGVIPAGVIAFMLVCGVCFSDAVFSFCFGGAPPPPT